MLLYIIFVSIIPANSFAQEENKSQKENKSEQEIKFSGYGATGFSFYNRNQLREYNQEVYYEGKFQADIKINKDIEAQLDFRGSSEDARVILREFSVKFEYLKRMKFKAGNIKRPFGIEQLTNQEDLYTVDRSYIQRTIEDLGYGGRSVSIQAYYNYSKKEKDFPYSYYLSLFKDNSLNNGIAARFSFHTSGIAYSVNYLFQQRGGEVKFTSHGFTSDISYESKNLSGSIEAFYIQDPVEGIRRKLANLDEIVFAGGAKITGVVSFDVDGEVIKVIEPMILAGFYVPELKETKAHTIETLIGANLYFHKDVRLRLNADGLFTKNQFNSKYTTIGSRFVLEIQVRF
jgi:hypothetical protein